MVATIDRDMLILVVVDRQFKISDIDYHRVIVFDVTVVFDLHRVLRKRSPRAMLFSIFAVALLLIGPLSLVIAGIGESSADGGYVGNKIVITYYPYKEDEKPTNIDGSLNGSPDDSSNYGSIFF